MDRQVVENILMEMGMPVRLKGFTYITDAVLLLDTPEWKNPKWTAMYYKIANMNNDTPTRVERAIRSALTSTRNRVGNYQMIEHYLGFTNCENSNSISYLYKNLKKEFPDSEEKIVSIQPKKNPTQTAEKQVTDTHTAAENELTMELLKKMVRTTILEMIQEPA